MKQWKSIVAMASNRVIGINGELPWHIKEDLQWFKQCTTGQVVVMGRKTFDFFGGRPLPKRQTVVISRQNIKLPEGVILLNSIEELKSFKTDKEIWVCGGSEIYKQTMSNCSDFYLTYIKKDYQGDAFLPDFSDYFKDYTVVKENEEFEIRHYKKNS